VNYAGGWQGLGAGDVPGPQGGRRVDLQEQKRILIMGMRSADPIFDIFAKTKRRTISVNPGDHEESPISHAIKVQII
jgi:hypothetical protein